MLVISRKVGQSVRIGDGDEAVVVTVVEVRSGRLRLGFDGPLHVPISRVDNDEPAAES